MAYQIELIDLAETELWEAVDFYDSQRPDLGKAFARELEATIKVIKNNPKQFPKVHKTRRKALLRRFPFAVFFDILGETIFVIAIFHTSRDPQVWQER